MLFVIHSSELPLVSDVGRTQHEWDTQEEAGVVCVLGAWEKLIKEVIDTANGKR